MNDASAQDRSAAIAGHACPAADLCRITKSFAGVRVLDGVSLAVRAGEVHALTGENGAGKSTLMKVLAGLHAPDSGEVRIDGRPLEPGNPHAALRAGVAMIYQELLPFLDLSIAENIFMGQELVKRIPGWLDKRAMEQRAGAWLAGLGLNLPAGRRMRDLSVAEMQTVEIAKALSHRARVIVMDEPTSALSAREAEALFGRIAELRRQGAAVIYISHKLEEVFRLADRVTVLRDGALVATKAAAELSPDELIALMVGRAAVVPSAPASSRDPVAGAASREESPAPMLTVRGLEKSGRFRRISFELRPGEILGVAGLMGAGRTDVVNALYGLAPADAGEVSVAGKPVRIRNPAEALDAGIGLVSEDRQLYGLVPTLGVHTNVTLAALARWCRAGLVQHADETRVAEEQVRAFSIKAAGPSQPVRHLSGGNQQKVVLARTLLREPKILLLDEPTRGIDIGAKAEVHRWIRRLAADGKAVLLVSSELPELFALSHRLLVMREGEIRAEFETQRTTPEAVLKFAMPS